MQTHIWMEVILFFPLLFWVGVGGGVVCFIVAFVQADTVMFAIMGQIKYYVFCLYLRLMQYNRYPVT